MMTPETATAAKNARPRIEGDREAEILAATLQLLATAGYDRLTMDAVATAAKASKATLYRRWSTKAELVIDALQRTGDALHVADADTGHLRDDLIAIGCNKAGLNDANSLAVMASVITALHHDEEFSHAFHERILQPKIAASRRIYERAQQRGEIRADADLDLLSHVLGAVILHSSFVLGKPVDNAAVTKIIDEVVIPAAVHACPKGTACSSDPPSSDPQSADV